MIYFLGIKQMYRLLTAPNDIYLYSDAINGILQLIMPDEGRNRKNDDGESKKQIISLRDFCIITNKYPYVYRFCTAHQGQPCKRGMMGHSSARINQYCLPEPPKALITNKNPQGTRYQTCIDSEVSTLIIILNFFPRLLNLSNLRPHNAHR